MAAVIVAGVQVATMLVAAPARLGGGGGLDLSLGRIVSALIVCLLLAGAAALLLKRGGGRIDWMARRGWKAMPTRRIEIIESRRIGAHAEVCLFRCDGEDYLVLSSTTTQRILRRTPIADRTA